jgi:hypothetical protein
VLWCTSKDLMVQLVIWMIVPKVLTENKTRRPMAILRSLASPREAFLERCIALAVATSDVG